MWELLTQSFSLVNLPYTLLLCGTMLYWALYVFGVVGDEALDFLGLDFDADVDVDADIDVDVDADIDVSTEGGGAGFSFLRFFHVGDVPVMLIFSILAVFMWVLSLLCNSVLGNSQVWVAGLLFFPILLVGLMFTKISITPFAPYLKHAFDQSSDTVEIVGKVCTIASLEATHEYGQAEFAKTGAPLMLNVKTREGTTLRQGEEAIVYGHDKATNTYLIAPFDLDGTPKQET